MADSESQTDESQKTEDPTPRRLEEARKRGQVITSREVTNWIMLFTITIIILVGGPAMLQSLSDVLKGFIANATTIPADGGSLRNIFTALLLQVGGILALPFIALMLAGILSALIQTGPLLTFEPLKPDLSKISMIKGFGRLFAMRSIVEFLKGLFKLIVVSIAGYLVLSPYFDGVEHFVGLDIEQGLFEFEDLFIKMMIAVLSVLFVLAIADYLYQRHDFMQKMRMSKQEIKDEFKQTEGDPHVKAKLRALREQKARQRMMQSVPEADVVITNPTHYAVALKYDSKEMPAPMMLAKGVDAVAEKIKEVAKEHKIPVIENAPLARALFDSMEIDETIPAQHWKAVAEIISYVFKLRGRKA